MLNHTRWFLTLGGVLVLSLGGYQARTKADDAKPVYRLPQLNSPNAGLQIINSPRHTFSLVVQENNSDDPVSSVTVLSNLHKNIKHRLPEQIIEGQTDTGHTFFVGDFYISPDDKWIFRTAKYVHTIGIACLYKKYGEADFRPAMRLRFDEAAWRYYATTHGWKSGKLPTVDEGPRIVDFVSWKKDARRLVFRLRPIDGYTPAQGYGWTGYYDTRTGRFGSAMSQKTRRR